MLLHHIRQSTFLQELALILPQVATDRRSLLDLSADQLCFLLRGERTTGRHSDALSVHIAEHADLV